MATARKVVKTLTLVKIRETKNTVVFGPEDGDPDAPAQNVYINKKWAQGVETITITAK